MESAQPGKLESELIAFKISQKDNVSDLSSRVQALPQELYDEIRRLTFTLPIGDHYVDDAYKPPSCLQVDHRLRHKLTEAYYNHSTFYVREHLLKKWLASLLAERIDFGINIRVCGKREPFIVNGETWHDKHLRARVWYVRERTPRLTDARMDSIKLEIVQEAGAATEWRSWREVARYLCI